MIGSMRALFPMFCVLTLLAGGGLFAQDKPEGVKPEEVRRPEKVEGNLYRFGDILFDTKTRAIRFAAAVIQDEVVLEYGLVHAITGKVHESLLATEIRPVDLQIVMKLLRYQASQRDIWPTYGDDGNIAKPMEDDGKGRVEFFITATDKAGKKSTFPLSDWVERRGGPDGDKPEKMPAGWFTYTGSGIHEGSYIAENEGAFLAIYRYAGSMFNAFQPLSDDDDVWFPSASKVPAIGTQVEVTIKPMPDVKASAGWKAPQAEDESKTKQPETKPSK